MASVTLLNPRNVNAKKLIVQRVIAARYKETEHVPRINGTNPLVLEGTSYLPIWLTTINSKLKKIDTVLDDAIKFMLRHTRIFRQMPKFLIVVVQRDKHNFKKLFRDGYYSTFFDYEILTITVPRSNEQKSKLTYQLHQSISFAQLYKKTNYIKSKGIKWFAEKARNLHKHKIYWRCKGQKVEHYSDSVTREFTYVMSLRQLNASVVCVPKESKKTQIECYSTYIMSRYNYMLLSKPLELMLFDVMVPVLHEVTVDHSFNEILTNMLTILLITTIFFVWSLTMNFDRITWKFLTIFEMITGNGNPRSPVTRSEMVAFSCEIIVGFFFGSILVSGLTSTTVVRKTDKEILSLVDMKDNNITFYPFFDPKLAEYNRFLQNVLSTKVKYTWLENEARFDFTFLRTMALYKNISVSTFNIDKLGVKIPRHVIVNKRLLAKKSEMKESMDLSACLIDMKVCPLFRERFNTFYWQIMESKLTDKQPSYHQRNIRYLQYKYVTGDLEKLEIDFDAESDMLNEVDLHSLWVILSFGFTFAFASLIFEILLKAGKCLQRSNDNLITNVVLNNI